MLKRRKPMGAKIIDVSGKILDENLKRDLNILMHDVFTAKEELERWQQTVSLLYSNLTQAMEVCGVIYHRDETLEVQLHDDRIVVREVEGCDLH